MNSKEITLTIGELATIVAYSAIIKDDYKAEEIVKKVLEPILKRNNVSIKEYMVEGLVAIIEVIKT